MISSTLAAYLTASAVIGLLIAFSAHNRKTGWKKSRTTLADALEDLYTDLGIADAGGDAAPLHFPLARTAPAPVDPGDFSLQLLNLRGALGASRKVTAGGAADTASRHEHELVQVQSR